MPTCACGFNYAKARIEGREVESYAVIHDADYRRVVKKEHAILSEKDKEKKLRLIATASQWVGSLIHCPDCGAWMLLGPEKRSKDHQFIILKPVNRRGTRACKIRNRDNR